MTEWTYEDVAKQGKRADDLERALANLVEDIYRTYTGQAVSGVAYVDAVKLLRTMRLTSTREMLARTGIGDAG